MREDSCSYEYELGDAFFESIDAPEIRKGHLHVQLEVKKSIGVYYLSFHIEGFVVVPCDRCLDDMDIDVQTDNELKVKLGTIFSDEDDIVIVPEEDGFINVAWFLYEFVELSLPIKHVHAWEECNRQMMGALSKHLSVSVDEDDDEEEIINDVEDSLHANADDDNRPIDPRWDALKKILNNNNK